MKRQEIALKLNRSELRTMLLNSLHPGTVHWGASLRSVRQTQEGTHELSFANGQSATFDLVIGADGAWSHVRPVVSSATPSYTGVTFIEIRLNDVDQKHPIVARLVGHGNLFALAENKGLIAQRMLVLSFGSMWSYVRKTVQALMRPIPKKHACGSLTRLPPGTRACWR